MPEISLRYGRTRVPFKFDDGRFDILGNSNPRRPLSDAEIGAKLDNPIDSAPLEEIVRPGETVLFVVPDATRETACGQIINLLVRRLIANGTAPYQMSIIFATGIHRKVTETEKQEILTPFIAQRIKTLDHGPRDFAQIVRVGETSSGIQVDLNTALVDHDHVVLIGGISFHYFAGFTGGRKLICPGLASSRTVSETHRLAFDCEMRSRRAGVGTGLLDGNAVHEAFVDAASKIDPSFCVSSIVDDTGAAVDVFCGDWQASHLAACTKFAEDHSVRITEKREVVDVSCGGYPHDINMKQAHKALDAASDACTEDGMIVLLAECADGLGRSDFLNWFDAPDSDALAEMLCSKYQVNGQTAWSLLKKAERFDVRILSVLNEYTTDRMRLKRIASIGEILPESDGYIIPNGAKTRIIC
jgi:nickel-dependent lactate racemase